MITTYEADSLKISVTILLDTGLPLSLAGATLVGVAQKSGAAAVAIPAAVENAAAGIASMTLAAGLLSRGSYVLQLRVQIGAEVQTVYAEQVEVQRSIVVPS